MMLDEEAVVKQGLLMPSEKEDHGDTEGIVEDSDSVRCPLSLRTSLVAVFAVLSCLWLYSATIFFPSTRQLFLPSQGGEHFHHHDQQPKRPHHKSTVHAGDVFLIQWVPDKTGDAQDNTISLYLHCGGKMGTLVVPIAVNANNTGRHYWTLPVDIPESDNYVIKFVPARRCHGRKHRAKYPAPPVFYSQTFTVKTRGRVKRQILDVSANPASDAPVASVTAPPADATDTPTTPPVDTPTSVVVTDTPTPTTPPPAPAPTTPTPAPPPADTSTPETSSTPPPPAKSTPTLTLTLIPSPASSPASSSTSTSFSQVVNTVLVTVTHTDHGTVVTSVGTSTTTSQMPVSTAVVAVASSSGKKSSSKGPIIGGVVGGLLVLAAVAGLIIWLVMRKRCKDRQRRYNTPAPDYVHDASHKPSPPISPYPDKSPTLPAVAPIPMPPPPRRPRANQPAPGTGIPIPPEEHSGAAISELPAEVEPSELYAGPVPSEKLGAAAAPMVGGYATHEPAPQYSAYVNGSNISNNASSPPQEGYRGVPTYPQNPAAYGAPPAGVPYGGSYQDRARAAYHDRGASNGSNVSRDAASPVSPNPGGLQHSASVASHGSEVSGMSSNWGQGGAGGTGGDQGSTISEEPGRPGNAAYETREGRIQE